MRYGTGVQDFSATVAALRAQVEQAVAQHGAGRGAVYLAAFDEVVDLFACAAADPMLGSVRWYGTTSIALSDGLIGSAQPVEFAVRVGFPNPAFGCEEGAREIWQPLAARIRARTNLEPGDHRHGDYDFWAIRMQQGAPQWSHVARYESRTGRLLR